VIEAGIWPNVALLLRAGTDQLVPLADGTTLFFNEVEAHVRLDSDGPLFTMTLAVENARPVLTRLIIERPREQDGLPRPGSEITATQLHAMPLESVLQTAISQAAAWAAGWGPDAGTAADSALRLRKRRAITDDLLRQVSEIVRSNPDTPTQAVRDSLHTSYRNASRWVSEARRRGFLDDQPEEGQK